MARKTNAAGIALIKKSEGCRLKAYLCPAGVPTIGWGHTGSVKLGQTINQHQADVILESDLEKFEEIVEKAVTVSLTDSQFSALVSFVFNVGPGKKGVKDGFVELKSGKPSSMLRKLNAGDYAGAADEFAKWNHIAGVENEGLALRRTNEETLFLSPFLA